MGKAPVGFALRSHFYCELPMKLMLRRELLRIFRVGRT